MTTLTESTMARIRAEIEVHEQHAADSRMRAGHADGANARALDLRAADWNESKAADLRRQLSRHFSLRRRIIAWKERGEELSVLLAMLEAEGVDLDTAPAEE